MDNYLNSRQDIQFKIKPKTYNGFVSAGSKFECGTDITDIEAQGDASNTRYGLVAIGNSTKVADVVPIKK